MLYKVYKNTSSLLLTRDHSSSNRAYHVTPFKTRIPHTFNPDQVVVQPDNVEDSSLEQDLLLLAKRGYAVFCIDGLNDKYLLAVPFNKVQVMVALDG